MMKNIVVVISNDPSLHGYSFNFFMNCKNRSCFNAAIKLFDDREGCIGTDMI